MHTLAILDKLEMTARMVISSLSRIAADHYKANAIIPKLFLTISNLTTNVVS